MNVSWNTYAEQYDLMTEYNPAYSDLLTRFDDALSAWQLESGARILEIGAGTGNFALRAARTHPQAVVLHTEPELAMQRRARSKAFAAGLTNLEFLPNSAETLNFAPGELSGSILVHMLYTLPNPRDVLSRLHGWLRPGAPVFACDLGRLMNVSDWRRYLVGEMVTTIGWGRTLCTLWRGRSVARANQQIANEQQAGRYWLHDRKEFAAAFRESGFTIESESTVYRGYSDLVLCRKP